MLLIRHPGKAETRMFRLSKGRTEKTVCMGEQVNLNLSFLADLNK